MNALLVGVDGSPGSRRAAEFAHGLARRFGARLTVLHVVEALPETALEAVGVTPELARERQFRQGQRVLEEVCKELGIDDAEKVIELGVAPEAICAEAEERDVDLIVVGAHGNGPHRQLPGSTGTRLLNIAGRNVTVIR